MVMSFLGSYLKHIGIYCKSYSTWLDVKIDEQLNRLLFWLVLSLAKLKDYVKFFEERNQKKGINV